MYGTRHAPAARSVIRLKICLAALASVFYGLPTAVAAAELVMFERRSCPWCREWDRVIAPIYPKSEIGRRAPLRRIDLDLAALPDFKLKRPVRYTPTFVLVDGGRELGRVEGYPGEDFFWARAERLVGSLSGNP